MSLSGQGAMLAKLEPPPAVGTDDEVGAAGVERQLVVGDRVAIAAAELHGAAIHVAHARRRVGDLAALRRTHQRHRVAVVHVDDGVGDAVGDDEDRLRGLRGVADEGVDAGWRHVVQLVARTTADQDQDQDQDQRPQDQKQL
jgi:hypothetical protein